MEGGGERIRRKRGVAWTAWRVGRTHAWSLPDVGLGDPHSDGAARVGSRWCENWWMKGRIWFEFGAICAVVAPVSVLPWHQSTEGVGWGLVGFRVIHRVVRHVRREKEGKWTNQKERRWRGRMGKRTATSTFRKMEPLRGR